MKIWKFEDVMIMGVMKDCMFDGGFISGGIMNLTPRQALSYCQKEALMVDVREANLNRFKMLDVPEVFYCPFSILADNFQNLPTDRLMIFVDSSGLHSKEAVKFLLEKGFGNRVANMAGGLVEWERDELPMILDKNEKLSGSCMCQLRPRNKKE